MKDKQKLERDQTAAMSEPYRRKCLRSTELKEILSRSTNVLPGRDLTEEMNQDDAPFYLAVNNGLKTDSLATKGWFKSGAVGKNKLNGLMKTMVQKAGIENDGLRNHSGRKRMIQTLSEHDIPPTQIAQLSGHKNLKSIENYSTVLNNEATDAHVKSAEQCDGWYHSFVLY